MSAPRRTLQGVRGLVLDVAALGGVGVFLWGVHQVYPPAALIAGGLLLTVTALIGAKKGGR